MCQISYCQYLRGVAIFFFFYMTSTSVWGLVLFPGESGPLDRPLDSVVGYWNGNPASVVAISPNYLVTCRHQNGGVGTSVWINGTEYTVGQVFNNGSVDLRVVRIDKLNGQPANLTEYVGIYSGTQDTNCDVVIGGYGFTRGSELKTPLSITYGYQWGGTQGGLQWGRNYVKGTSTVQYGSYFSKALVASFDGPFSIAHVAGEVGLAAGDSGGGWFIKDWQGKWQVVGLSAYVDHLGHENVSAQSWFGNPTTGTEYPDSLYAIRISAYADWINNNILKSIIAPGDANRDGKVNITDLGILASNYGQLSGMNWSTGDFNADAAVNIVDLGILATNYGYGTGGELLSSSYDMEGGGVPEPATIVFLGIGLTAMSVEISRRKR